LGHIIESLSGSAGLKRVLVDYDKLMLSPELELNRIAEKLDLEIDQIELKIYTSEFLDEALRHTAYSLDDLSLDDACPPLVREIYRTLLEIASDKADLENRALQDQIASWVNEYERLKPILALVDKAFARNKEVTYQIARLNQAVVERDEQIANLNREAVGRDEQITNIRQAIAGRDDQITKLREAIVGRDEQIANINQAMIEGHKRNTELKSHIEDLYASTSWRLTRPIRAAKSLLVNPRATKSEPPKLS
jgi:hypothetical protein